MAPRQTGSRWNFDLVTATAGDLDILPCTIWKEQAAKISAKLEEGGRSLEKAMTSGMVLKIQGTTWLGNDGRLYVKVTSIEPDFSRRGRLHAEVQQGMAAIRKAGVSSERLRRTYRHADPRKAFHGVGVKFRTTDVRPARIMVLGPAEAQGVGDFKSRLESDKASRLEVLYRATSWTAKSNIETMQAHFNEALRQEMDLVLLVRGGGHWSDLRGFEREDLALAIHNSRVPVATAVGHEANLSLADRAAALSFATPTAAAEAISNELRREQRPAPKQKREEEVADTDKEKDPVLQEMKGAQLHAALLARDIQNVSAAYNNDLLEYAERRVRTISRLTTAAVAAALTIILGSEQTLTLFQAAAGPTGDWLYIALVTVLSASLVWQYLAGRKISQPPSKPMKYPYSTVEAWRLATKQVRSVKGLRELRHHRPL